MHCLISGSQYADHSLMHIMIGVVIALIVLGIIIICVFHRRRAMRLKKNKQEIEVRYVTRGPPTHCNKQMDGANDKLLLRERTEKVSIV